MDTWQKWLEFYHKKYGHNFVVQKIADKPYPWVNYGTKEYEEFIKKEKFVSQREVFHDEIVFDIDMDKNMHKATARKEAKQIAKKISERMEEIGISHSTWLSGGSGVHIHTFFPELYQYNTLDSRLMKKSFIKVIAAGMIRPRNLNGSVQTQTLVTIQLEESPHRKGGKKELLYEFKTETVNKFTDNIKEKFLEQISKNNTIRKVYGNQEEGETPKIITFLQNEEFNTYADGRDRALFILAAYYKQFNTNKDTVQKLKDWNKKVLKGYFNNYTIRSKVSSAKPCLPMNYAIELLDDLGIDKKHIIEE